MPGALEEWRRLGAVWVASVGVLVRFKCGMAEFKRVQMLTEAEFGPPEDGAVGG